jgi:hypothetical protein
MLSDAMRSVARDAGLDVVPYQSDLGFTAIRESDDRYFVFILNTNRARTDLSGIWGNSLRHGSILSGVGASGKPGAVQSGAR